MLKWAMESNVDISFVCFCL